MPRKKEISAAQRDTLLKMLEARFQANMKRHKDVTWSAVKKRLDTSREKLWSLNAMESSGGEPDVVAVDAKTGEMIFVDCSTQSPKERRSLCYDNEALEARRENKPKGSAIAMATAMGVDILTVEEYQHLQTLGEFDTSTSSWVKTPAKIRALGGAIFCDRRYDTVFIYHNGAESYYAARGFRSSLRV